MCSANLDFTYTYAPMHKFCACFRDICHLRYLKTMFTCAQQNLTLLKLMHLCTNFVLVKYHLISECSNKETRSLNELILNFLMHDNLEIHILVTH